MRVVIIIATASDDKSDTDGLRNERNPLPVRFRRAEQRADDGRYTAEPTAADLARYFHLTDASLSTLAVPLLPNPILSSATGLRRIMR